MFARDVRLNPEPASRHRKNPHPLSELDNPSVCVSAGLHREGLGGGPVNRVLFEEEVAYESEERWEGIRVGGGDGTLSADFAPEGAGDSTLREDWEVAHCAGREGLVGERREFEPDFGGHPYFGGHAQE